MATLEPVDGLAQLAFLIHGTLERQAAERDLSMVQARLLGILRDRRPTMQQLGKLIGLDKSSVSGLVDRASRRGLVARVPSPDDRRSFLVELTDQGRAVAAAASAAFAADVHEMLNRLPADDQTTLTRLVGDFVVAQAAAGGVDLS